MADFEKVGGVGSLAEAVVESVRHDDDGDTYTVTVSDVVALAAIVHRSKRDEVLRVATMTNVRHVFPPPTEPMNTFDDASCTAFGYGAPVEVFADTAPGYGRWIPATVCGRRCDSKRRCVQSAAVGTCDLGDGRLGCKHGECVYHVYIDSKRRQKVEMSPWEVRAPTDRPATLNDAECTAMEPVLMPMPPPPPPHRQQP